MDPPVGTQVAILTTRASIPTGRWCTALDSARCCCTSALLSAINRLTTVSVSSRLCVCCTEYELHHDLALRLANPVSNGRAETLKAHRPAPRPVERHSYAIQVFNLPPSARVFSRLLTTSRAVFYMADIDGTSPAVGSSKLPELPLDLVLSMDLASASDRTTALGTTTINERHDSARTSICSSDTGSNNTISSKKARKRVRFEESVCCSYFDANCWSPQPEPEAVPQPQLRRKPSLMSRSWARIKLRNSSDDSDVGSSPPISLERLKNGNHSADLLDTAGRRSSFAPGRTHSLAYSIHQPLRESAGRRYNRAQTTVCWKAAAPTAKGDWDDLLGTKPQRPQMSRALTY